MSEFKEKSSLPRRCTVKVESTDYGDTQIFIDDAVVLARFYSFVKSRCYDNEVFMRGQAGDHAGLRPSLFRGCDVQMASKRAAAYGDFLNRLEAVLGPHRFRRDNIGALLQHYGFRTPWIDLVDNMFVATWFACHRFDAETKMYAPSREPYGWLTFVVVGSGFGAIPWIDLRKNHSSMSTRLQAQHGLSAASQHDGNAIVGYDYADQVAARIKFPNSAEFSLAGRFFQSSFLFPNIRLDETYKIVLKSGANALAANVESDFGLDQGVLGRATKLRYRPPRRAA